MDPELGVYTVRNLLDEPDEDLSSLLHVLARFKAQSRRPTENAYRALLRCSTDYTLRRGLGTHGTAEEMDIDDIDSAPAGIGWHLAMAALRDAELGGVDLGVGGMEQLLRLSTVHPPVLPSLLVDFADSATPPTPSMYNAIARIAIASSNMEQLVVLVHEMLERDVAPSTALLKHVVRMACEWGCPRLALQIVEKVETSSQDGEKVDTATWIQILMASADNQFLSGVLSAWDRAVGSKTYLPDEGLILTVLNVAARWGRPDLATKALGLLPNLRIRPRELHLVPLLEAYVTSGQLPEAIKVLTAIRAAGMIPTMTTAEPIASSLNTVELIDQAFYALEDLRKNGEPVDIAAFNAVIEASVRLKDLQRVRATYAAAVDLGVRPDLDTFNTVLSACLDAQHRPLADTIFSDMIAGKISPNLSTYRTMINLCLTQHTYEDAFFYLEKMKSDGIKPPYPVYQVLIRKCIAANDKRWRLVKEELETLGYHIDRDTQYRLNHPSAPADDPD